MKKKLAGSAAALLASGMLFGATAQAEQKPVEVQVYYPSMHFVIDGSEYAPPEGQQGFIYEGSTYVPLRFISYALQKAVKWDGDTYTVKVDKPSDTDTVSIRDYNANTLVRKPASAASVDTAALKADKIEVYMESIHYVFDGKEKQPAEDLPGFIYKDTLYVPMRFFSESVGKSIGWDPKTYTVSAKIDEPATPDTQKPAETTNTPAVPPVTGGGGIVSGGGGGGIESGGGGGGIVSGGGGGTVKPSYDSLISAAQSQLTALQNGCKADLNALADRYITSKDGSLITQGLAKVAECDNQFNAIVNNLESQLKANQYDTAVIQQYKDEYTQIKEQAKNDLLKRIGE
jgi:uncharacterized membrane protein YgcG